MLAESRCVLAPAPASCQALHQTADSRADLRIRNTGKIAHKLNRGTVLAAMLERDDFAICIQAFEEVSDIHFQLARYFEQPTDAYPVGAGFIFLNLLIGNFESRGEMLLRWVVPWGGKAIGRNSLRCVVFAKTEAKAYDPKCLASSEETDHERQDGRPAQRHHHAAH